MLPLLACYAGRARLHYERSQQLLPPAYRNALRPAQALGSIYRDLLELIEDEGFPAHKECLQTSRARRVAVAARGWVTGALQ